MDNELLLLADLVEPVGLNTFRGKLVWFIVGIVDNELLAEFVEPVVLVIFGA